MDDAEHELAEATLENFVDATLIQNTLTFWQKVITRKEELQEELKMQMGGTMDDYFSKLVILNAQNSLKKSKLHNILTVNGLLDRLIRRAMEEPKFAKPSNFSLPTVHWSYAEGDSRNKDLFMHKLEVELLKEECQVLMLSFIKE